MEAIAAVEFESVLLAVELLLAVEVLLLVLVLLLLAAAGELVAEF